MSQALPSGSREILNSILSSTTDFVKKTMLPTDIANVRDGVIPCKRIDRFSIGTPDDSPVCVHSEKNVGHLLVITTN